MDYNDVSVFLRVVELGSFTRAAKALGVEKSSVSRSVARLESDLGVRLLQRTTRQLNITDAGQAFLVRARAAHAGLEEAAAAARELGTEPRGIVRVTAPADAATFGLGEAVAEFVRQYPGIRVDLSLNSTAVDLIAEGFDLAVRAGRLRDSSLIARGVGSVDVHLFASPEYLERRGRPRSLSDLERHDCVVFRGHAQRATWKLTGKRGVESVEVTGSISADEMAFVARAVVGGAGIGLITPLLASDFVHRGQLEIVLPNYRLAGGGLHVVLPSSSFVPRRVILLRDHLVEFLTARLGAAQSTCAARRGG